MRPRTCVPVSFCRHLTSCLSLASPSPLNISSHHTSTPFYSSPQLRLLLPSSWDQLRYRQHFFAQCFGVSNCFDVLLRRPSEPASWLCRNEFLAGFKYNTRDYRSFTFQVHTTNLCSKVVSVQCNTMNRELGTTSPSEPWTTKMKPITLSEWTVNLKYACVRAWVTRAFQRLGRDWTVNVEQWARVNRRFCSMRNFGKRVMRSVFFIYALEGDLRRIYIYEIIFIRFNLILLEHHDK